VWAPPCLALLALPRSPTPPLISSTLAMRTAHHVFLAPAQLSSCGAGAGAAAASSTGGPDPAARMAEQAKQQGIDTSVTILRLGHAESQGEEGLPKFGAEGVDAATRAKLEKRAARKARMAEKRAAAAAAAATR
jgi:hypothetical protein